MQVFRPDPHEPGEEQSFIWKGTEPGELPTPAAAIAIAAPWAILPEDLARTLEIDRLGTSATPDGIAQVEAKRWLNRSRD